MKAAAIFAPNSLQIPKMKYTALSIASGVLALGALVLAFMLPYRHFFIKNDLSPIFFGLFGIVQVVFWRLAKQERIQLDLAQKGWFGKSVLYTLSFILIAMSIVCLSIMLFLMWAFSDGFGFG